MVSMNQPTNDANSTMTPSSSSMSATAASAKATAATVTASSYSSQVIMMSTNIVLLTETHLVEYGNIETAEVHVQAETDSGLNSRGHSGTPTPTSLSSRVVQEVIPLVTDVQLESSVSSSSLEDRLKEASSSSSFLLKESPERTLSLTTESSEEDPQEEDHGDIPCATLCVNTDWTASNVETTSVVYSRPEIIFANAIKPTPDSMVGINFHDQDGAVYISSIAHDSLFCGCNLRVGDRVVAVNNISCIGAKKAKQVVKLLHKTDCNSKSKSKNLPASLAARTVSICVRNEQGDPRTVSTSIQKPDRFTRLGLSLVNKRGSLKVTRIDPDSLFSNTLLLPRHRCLRINDMPCDHLSSHEAAKLIIAAADRVTIISQPHQQAAMVISASERRLRRHERWFLAVLAVMRMIGVPVSSSSRNSPRLIAY